MLRCCEGGRPLSVEVTRRTRPAPALEKEADMGREGTATRTQRVAAAGAAEPGTALRASSVKLQSSPMSVSAYAAKSDRG
jgi:hypothetical protein